MVRRSDNLVTGGACPGCRSRGARPGLRTTAFIERDLLGGTCLNRGCIPTKTMIASAKVAQQVCRTAPAAHVHRSLAEGVIVAAGSVHRPSPDTLRGPDA